MDFVLENKSTTDNTGHNIDYKAISELVEEGGQPAVVSCVMQLGTQKQKPGLDDKTFTLVPIEDEEKKEELLTTLYSNYSEKFVTEKGLDDIYEEEEGYMLNFHVFDNKFINTDKKSYYTSKEEAQQVLKAAKDMGGKWAAAVKKNPNVSEMVTLGECLRLPFSLYNVSPCPEFAVAIDLLDSEIPLNMYSPEESGYVNYRVHVNSFGRDIQGWKAPSGGKTYSNNSKPYKLATAIKKPEFYDLSSKNCNNIGLFLGAKLSVDVAKNGDDNSFISIKSFGKLREKDEEKAPKPLSTPVGITFQSATLDDFIKFNMPKKYIERIKQAEEFVEGSNIYKVVADWEEYLSDKYNSTSTGDGEVSNDVPEDDSTSQVGTTVVSEDEDPFGDEE